MNLAQFGKLVYRKYQLRLFEYPAHLPRTPGPDPPPGFTVHIYGTLQEVPEEIAREAMPLGAIDLMRWRMRRGRARLFVVFDEKRSMASYCWVQDWRPYVRSFPGVPRNGRMVGFGWTHPDHRGRGLFTFMVRRCVIYCDRTERPYGYALVSNAASLRACEKAEYVFVGEFAIRRWFWFLTFSRRVPKSS